MGYKRRKKTYNLVFEDADNEFEGLEVKTGMVSLGTYLQVGSLLEEDLTKEVVDELFGAFADDILISWNIEANPDDDDNEDLVPTTKAGLYSLDLPFTMKIITTWRDAMRGVSESDPLAGDSDSGETSLEESMTMESLSGNRAS
jgi:hypothetical protein